jgi:pimeloyl-ACP methyl ester carboxylesterase
MTAVLKGFVDAPHGEVHFRYGGGGPVVVMLHDTPRSSAVHARNIEWLGEHFTVVAPDTPGCGESAPLPQPDPSIPDFAAALAGTLSALGIGRCAIYAPHGAGKIALQFAAEYPERVALTVLDGLPMQAEPASSAELERHLQVFAPAADGSHLPQEWSRVLDVHRWAPWFDRKSATRLTTPLPDDLELHEYATDVLMSAGRWRDAARAASRWPAAPHIARLRSPTVFVDREDDPTDASLDRLPHPLPAVCSVERIPSQLPAWRSRLLELLRQADLTRTAWNTAHPAPGIGSHTGQRYVNLVNGQVRVRLGGGTDGLPLLLLHDAPGSSASLRPLAAALAGERATIAPDLPGLGESHPLPYPSLGSYVTALVEVLEGLGCGCVDVFAEGLGTCFAVALAAHHPSLVRRVALDGLPLVRSRDRAPFTRHYCPSLVPDRHGTHLLRAWHQLRDAEASWPWFDRSAAAIRRRAPDLDPERLQVRLVDMSKQLPSYGDPARAALQAAVRDILRGVHQPVLLFDAAGDVRYAGTRRASRHLKHAKVVARPASLEERTATLREFYD